MSEICQIKEIKPHPNADALEIAVIKGWESCVVKGRHKVGDKVVYFPPNSVLPAQVSDPMNITKYLSKGRVLCANLRGVKSFGAVMHLSLRPDLQSLDVGTDVSTLLGVTKYEPPISEQCGDAEKESSVFHKYYKMKNYKDYPDLFDNSNYVTVTEKVHGCLHENTKVLLSNGDEKSIKNIKVGEELITFDIKNKQFTTNNVTNVIVQDVTEELDWYELEFSNGRKILCTEDHKFLVNENGNFIWIQAKDLEEKHKLV